jgi:hypothetical protein
VRHAQRRRAAGGVATANGETRLRDTILCGAGFVMLAVPHYEWDAWSGDEGEQDADLRVRLADALLPPLQQPQPPAGGARPDADARLRDAALRGGGFAPLPLPHSEWAAVRGAQLAEDAYLRARLAALGLARA